jgi:hypothetical protein
MTPDLLTRYVHYIATRILNADELMTQQSVSRNMDGLGNPIAYGLNAIYRDGALMNASAALNNTTVSFTPIDATKPMLVFCRGIWEPFTMAPLNIGSSSALFLNYVVVSTPQAGGEAGDAELGELQLSFSAISTNGPPNQANNELERNTNPISVLTLVDGALSIVDLVYPQAKGSGLLSGLVQLTTNTSHGLALASDDVAVMNERVPTDGSIATGKVIPVAVTGLNPDNSPKVDPANIGGIDSKALIYAPGVNTVEGELTSLAGSIAGVVSALNGHINKPLGSGVHPMPNYADVGAAPVSHVGADLTLAHNPAFTSDHQGFVVTRNPANAPAFADMAYVVQDNHGNPIAGIKHNGDLLSTNTNYPLLSAALAALFGHVSQTVATNPHGTTLAELGGVDLPTMQAGDQNAIVVAEAAAAAAVPGIVTSLLPCLIASPGYIAFPTGDKKLMLQWGQCPNVTGGHNGTQVFGTEFMNACFGVMISDVWSDGHSSLPMVVDGSVTTSQFGWTTGAGSEVGGNCHPYWFAIGY